MQGTVTSGGTGRNRSSFPRFWTRYQGKIAEERYAEPNSFRLLATLARRLAPAGRLLAKLARAAAAKLPLADACGAVAAAVLHEILQILLAVRVSDLLVRLYPPIGNDDDAAIAADRPRVRLAGMIDVAGHVPARLAVDGPLLVERE